jgi:hypothetical protein
MKYLKMLGLAAIAALALTAVLGAGSASAATFLCKTKANPCPEHYPIGTVISASLETGTHAVLTTNLGKITCKKSTVTGKTTTTEGHGEITGLTFSECTDPFNNPCTVKAVNLPYTADIATATAGVVNGNGTMTVTPKAGGTGNPGATVECGSFMNCKFTSTAIALDVIGNAPAKVIASNEPLNREGGLCPSESFWDAEYTVTQPNPLYVI